MIIIQAELYRDGGSLSLTTETDGKFRKVWIQYNLSTEDYESPTLLDGTGSSAKVLCKLTWKDVYSLLAQAPVDFSRSRFYLAMKSNLGRMIEQKDLDEYFIACECQLNHIRNLAEAKMTD